MSRRFLKEKFHAHEYDIPLERVGHCQGPHDLSFLFEPLSLSYDPKCEGHPFKVKGITDIKLCSNVLQFPIKIYSFEIFTRALPGSSLVIY